MDDARHEPDAGQAEGRFVGAGDARRGRTAGPTILVFVEDTCRAFAVLYLVAVLGPAIEDPTSTFPPGAGQQTFWVAVAVPVVGFLLDLYRAVLVLLRMARATLRGLHRVVPRRGHLGRWYHYSFREPLAAPDQAREALARLCGYRLQADDYRIASIRPSIRGWRPGVLVSVARRSRSSRHWECRYVRWVGDPHELWLIRSAVRHAERMETAPVRRERRVNALEVMSTDEMDGLLGRPGEGPDRDGRGSGPRTPQ